MPPFTNDTIISYFFLHSRTVESVDFSSTDRRVKKTLIVVASVNLKLGKSSVVFGIIIQASAENAEAIRCQDPSVQHVGLVLLVGFRALTV